MGLLQGGFSRSKERRRAARKSHSGDAWIRVDGSFAVLTCKVLDLSGSGVRLSSADASKIPAAFVFMTSRSGTGRRARVKWRRGNQIGAEFY